MCPPQSCTCPRPFNGFTLIELLVVIAIVAILAALLFPVIGRSRESARKVEATNDVRQLVAATNLYLADYQKFPLNEVQSNARWDTVYGDPGGLYSSADLCNVLRAVPDDRFNTNNRLNPGETKYIDPKPAKDPISPRSGIATQETTGPEGHTIRKGAFVDPWGMEYVVFLDGDNDYSIKTALSWFYWDDTANGRLTGNSRVEAASLGEDHAFGDNGNGKVDGSDDVVSWR